MYIFAPSSCLVSVVRKGISSPGTGVTDSELPATWMLRAIPRSSGRAVGAFKHRASSIFLVLLFLSVTLFCLFVLLGTGPSVGDGELALSGRSSGDAWP